MTDSRRFRPVVRTVTRRPSAVRVGLLLALASILASCTPDNGNGGESANHMSITATPATQNVSQGGQGAAHVGITRPPSVTGAIALSFNGPAGQLLATDTVPAGVSSADVALDIPLTLPPGNNSVTVKASATGTSDATSSIALNVGARIGIAITRAFCSKYTVLWAASMADGMPWVQRNIVNNSFSLAMATTRGMIAYTKLNLTTNDITTHLVADAVANLAASEDSSCTAEPAKVSVPGIIQNADPTWDTYVAATWQQLDLSGPPTIGATVPFTLMLRPGTVDIVAAWRAASGIPIGGLYLPGIVIPPVGQLMLNLNASNRLTFVTGALALGNLLSTPTVVRSSLYTPGGTRGMIYDTPSSVSPTYPLYGVSPSFLPAGGLHIFDATATGSADVRKITLDLQFVPSGMTATLPGPIGYTASCLSTPGSPVRIGFTGTIVPGLDQMWKMTMQQGTTGSIRKVEMNFGPAYLIGGQAFNFFTTDWPNLNYNRNWSLQPNSTITLSNTASGSNLTGGATSFTPVIGKTVSEAQHSGTMQCP